MGQLRSTNTAGLLLRQPITNTSGVLKDTVRFTGMRRTVKAKRVLLIVQSPSLSIGAVNYGL